jgi:hypothetical protein
MNSLTRSTIVVICLTVCAGAFYLAQGGMPDCETTGSGFLVNADPQSGYQFASADLYRFSFAQLEAMVRADAAVRFPNTRVELGLVKPDHGVLTMPVVLFGPNHQTQAFLYAFVPEKNSWKIASTRRLWFVPPSQIARGLRV